MYFIDISDLEEKMLFPGCKAQIVHSKNMTLVHWTLDEGTHFIEHSHPHEQISTIIEGQFRFTINKEIRVLDVGSMAIIPPNAVHFGKALTRCRMIDTFYPIRKDYQ